MEKIKIRELWYAFENASWEIKDMKSKTVRKVGKHEKYEFRVLTKVVSGNKIIHWVKVYYDKKLLLDSIPIIDWNAKPFVDMVKKLYPEKVR